MEFAGFVPVGVQPFETAACVAQVARTGDHSGADIVQNCITNAITCHSDLSTLQEPGSGWNAQRLGRTVVSTITSRVRMVSEPFCKSLSESQAGELFSDVTGCAADGLIGRAEQFCSGDRSVAHQI